MPPVTCEWNFYIASDDSSKLYLSSNDDPANKNLVASVDGWTFKKQWKKYGEAQKGTVSLVQGELYYPEAIHKEGGGDDNLAVGWECLEHGIALQVISGEYTTIYIGADVSLQ
uniref:PA14 domain-containing protein n=1 Tax=Skeletonema marinoi TaxID=267567 RepID=A0A7S2LMN8_9STRA|mmetsp:Transcript_27019/g.45809  ORF Transcript_27019/g.45809 Transcript_27019/m.45809 type:complete len:113 (+) Transcript_27019:234-572(+)